MRPVTYICNEFTVLTDVAIPHPLITISAKLLVTEYVEHSESFAKLKKYMGKTFN